jgi:hypothetical protein
MLGLPPAPPPLATKRANPLTSKPFIGIAGLVAGLVLGSAIGSAGNDHASTTATPTVATSAPTAPAAPATSAPAEPSSEPSTEPSSDPTTTPPTKKDYPGLSSRKFKLLVKDPDSYIGQTYTIYGEITQFDAATGTDTFRADTGAKKLKISYGYVDYPQNSFLSGDESQLKKLVEGDCFTAKVTVLGSFSYDTQSGGNTTVPLFQVDSIKVYGSTS